MASTLLEKYAPRLRIAEQYYKANSGKQLDKQRALTTAVCLENVNKVMNEAFENSVGTQRADL